MTVTQDQFTHVKEDIRTLSGMVSEIQQTVTIHTIRLSKIDARLDRMDGRLDNVAGTLDGLQTAVSGLQGSVNEILALIRSGR